MATVWTVTINTQFTQIQGSERVMDVTLLAPTGATYTTGGDSITAAQVGLDVIDFVIAMPDGNAANTNGVGLVAPNLGSGPGATSVKLQLFGTGGSSGATLVELAGATSVAAFGIRARFYGVA